MDEDAVGEDFQLLRVGGVGEEKVGDPPFADDGDGVVFFLVIPEANDDVEGEVAPKLAAGKIPREDEPLADGWVGRAGVGRADVGTCEVRGGHALLLHIEVALVAPCKCLAEN